MIYPHTIHNYDTENIYIYTCIYDYCHCHYSYCYYYTNKQTNIADYIYCIQTYYTYTYIHTAYVLYRCAYDNSYDYKLQHTVTVFTSTYLLYSKMLLFPTLEARAKLIFKAVFGICCNSIINF